MGGRLGRRDRCVLQLAIRSARRHSRIGRILGARRWAAGQLAGLTWGYLPAALAVALIPIYVIWIERIVDEDRRPGTSARRAVVVASGCALLASWLHPWQGATILMITAGLVLLRRSKEWLRALAVPMVAGLLPLLYYKLLARESATWALGEQVGQHGPGPVGAFVAVLLPLVVPAVLGLRRPRADTSIAEWSLVLWPLSAIAAYFTYRQAPSHFLLGLAIPLGVLAVRACLRLRGHASAALAVAMMVGLTLPGMAYLARDMRRTIDRNAQPFVLTTDEQRAMSFLSRRRAPVASSRACIWARPSPPSPVEGPSWDIRTGPRTSPNRVRVAANLLSQTQSAEAAGKIVDTYRPAFLLARCGESAPLEAELGSRVAAVHRFGCTSVYEIEP